MRITANRLRQFIRETLYRASVPARFNLPPIDIDADSTNDAGKKAANAYFSQHNVRGIDPFSISVEPITVRGPTIGDLKLLRQRFDQLRRMLINPQSWSLIDLKNDILPDIERIALDDHFEDIDEIVLRAMNAHDAADEWRQLKYSAATQSDVDHAEKLFIDKLNRFDAAVDNLLDDINEREFGIR